jgi:hypothetical protein
MRISSRDKTEKWRITLRDERKLLAENIAMARELGAKFDKHGKRGRIGLDSGRSCGGTTLSRLIIALG